MPVAPAPTAPKKSAGIDTARSKRPPSIGKTVKLRATERGQYGHPTANLIEPGTVFPMAVKDLELKETRLKTASLIKNDERREATEHWIGARDTMTIDGVDYLLPSWTEDAATPVPVEDSETAEPEPSSSSREEDVI